MGLFSGGCFCSRNEDDPKSVDVGFFGVKGDSETKLRSSLSWDVRHNRLVVIYRRFETTLSVST